VSVFGLGIFSSSSGESASLNAVSISVSEAFSRVGSDSSARI
jgi:hypothetical protein